MTELDLSAAVEAAASAIVICRWAPESSSGVPVSAYDRAIAEAAILAVVPLIAKAVREQVAERIRAELVCCNQYAELAHLRDRPGFEGYDELSRELRRHGDGICYWAEASALIACGDGSTP